MKTFRKRTASRHRTALAWVLMAAACSSAAFAGERKFMVILATSPKQFPSTGTPPGGFIPQNLIDREYFDTTAGNDVGSFAEYWEEISYRDVTISGETAGWIELPWAIRPPRFNPNSTAAPQPFDHEDNGAFISPENFMDLDGNGVHEYGASERFTTSVAMVTIDIDGDPNGAENGPFAPGPGSGEVSMRGRGAAFPVWMPGERFVDVDGDGRWDGLDENKNWMDWNNNGRPDLPGPFVDLDGNGEAENEGDCTYFSDSDNDGFPDCCPQGPTFACSCPPHVMPSPDGEIRDCNGNLVPDPCDINCDSTACRDLVWFQDMAANDPIGLEIICAVRFLDVSPLRAVGEDCVPRPDGILDICQFENPGNNGCRDPGSEEICNRFPDCEELPRDDPRVDPPARCEFADESGDNDGELDIVEPFENFLRRWDPCLLDPDVSPQNIISEAANWIKAYDPLSPSAGALNEQGELVGGFDLDCNSGSISYSVNYGDPAYILRNYPGDPERVIAQAQARPIYGQHDPLQRLEDPDCACAIGFNFVAFERGSKEDCCRGGSFVGRGREERRCGRLIADSGSPSGQRFVTKTDSENLTDDHVCAAIRPDFAGGPCMDFDINRSGNIDSTERSVCIAGFHAQYDSPDFWENRVEPDGDGPGGTTRSTTKLQIQRAGPGVIAVATHTPKPDWYEDAWKDRYGRGNDCYDVEGNPGPCTPPPWPDDGGFRNSPIVVPFDDTDEDTYNAQIEDNGRTPADRRYFNANWGGFNGDGTGGPEDDERFLRYETGPLGNGGFEEVANAPILPEESQGENAVAIFFDGFVEYDDLPSSKYHWKGDEWFGEITSPFRSWIGVTDTAIVHTAGTAAFDPTSPVEGRLHVPAIWGNDIGAHDPNRPTTGRDGVTPPAGPYAINIHGALGRDGGNVMLMELLTWVRMGDHTNNGIAWDQVNFFSFHPYAGPSGENRGFGDYNLDGLIDQGEVRPAGSDNYLVDSDIFSVDDGTTTNYPFNRRRMVEDCIEVLDDGGVDFDEFVDPVAMDAINCGGGPFVTLLPDQYRADPLGLPVFDDFLTASGVLSGIVLLPAGSHAPNEFPLSPSFAPVHNEDGLGDAQFMAGQFPRAPQTPQINWSMWVHDLVIALDVSAEGGSQPTGSFQKEYSAHEYLHAWEGFPDLYDLDVFLPPGPQINCPIADWDIMASGGLVHPTPILKERPCTRWIEPTDLSTILTPGVDATLTFPPAEFVRDDSYFFIEDLARPENVGSGPPEAFIERFYFWSAGSGFDQRMPGPGLLILHTDTQANPEALPPQQRVGSHFTYFIVQADGLDQLTNCDSTGDAGDPWPGATGKTKFDCGTNPSARWYRGSACTGLSITDIVPDQFGSMQVTMNWLPQDIPGFRFTNPPGGVSVGNPPAVIYQVRGTATDRFGGTWIRLFHTDDPDDLSIDPNGANFVGIVQKTSSGQVEAAADWDISDVPDDRYQIFAELIPGRGTDGNESPVTPVRPGRNNVGNGVVDINNVNTNRIVASGQRAFGGSTTVSAIANDSEQDINFFALGVRVGDQLTLGRFTGGNQHLRTITAIENGGIVLRVSAPLPGNFEFVPWQVSRAGSTARSETWHLECVTEDGREWTVHSSLTQPAPEDESQPSPFERAITGQLYSSVNDAVRFRIVQGSRPFFLGDTFTFTTTGITAPSPGVTVLGNRISENPRAVIVAGPLSGLPPLTVQFDGSRSRDPNGVPLNFLWDFGDGSTATGQIVSHVFTQPRRHTVTLRVTNPLSGRFGEATVDIDVTNNSPNAVAIAAPTSGPTPLLVQFDATQSSDPETTDKNQLVYQWKFGDGTGANDSGNPGTIFATVSHLYERRADGTLCTGTNPCQFVAVLTVTDPGGKSDTDTVTINVGNSSPVISITATTSLEGPDPLEVVFNSANTRDPDGHPVCIEWIWGDGTPRECWPPSGASGATNGSVPHEYQLPTGESSGSFQTRAIVRDYPFLAGPIPGCDGSCTGIEQGAGSTVSWAGVLVRVSEVGVSPSAPTARFTIAPNPPVLHEPFTVNGSASTDRPAGTGAITSYLWNWDDGSPTSSGVIATHVYTSPGTYTIRLQVRDNDVPPNTDVATRTVTVLPEAQDEDGENNAPTAVIRSSATEIRRGQPITFDARDSTDPDGDPLLYRWNLGDGTIRTGAVVTHTYLASGQYVVRLTVQDPQNGFDEESLPITVLGDDQNRPPVAIIATGLRTLTTQQPVTFDGRNSFDPDGDPITYDWEVRREGVLISGSETGSRLDWVFESTGSHTVSLRVTDGFGASSSRTVEAVTVLPRSAPVDGGDDEPGQDIPGDNGDSADQRPGGFLCGLGMHMGLLGTLLGLFAMAVSSRRRFA